MVGLGHRIKSFRPPAFFSGIASSAGPLLAFRLFELIDAVTGSGPGTLPAGKRTKSRSAP